MIKFTLNGKTDFTVESCTYADYATIIQTLLGKSIDFSIEEQEVPLLITTKTEDERNKIISLLSKNANCCFNDQFCKNCDCVTCSEKYLESVIKVVN